VAPFFPPFSFPQVRNINVPGKEPVPFFSTLQSIRFWLLHPDLSQEIVRINDEKTLPHIPFILENQDNNLLPPCFPKETIEHMSDGYEWFEPFRRTAPLWQATYHGSPRVLFLHILYFGDGIQLWKRNQQGYEVVTSTLGEFSEGIHFLSPSFDLPCSNVTTSPSRAEKLNPLTCHHVEHDVVKGHNRGLLRQFLRQGVGPTGGRHADGNQGS